MFSYNAGEGFLKYIFLPSSRSEIHIRDTHKAEAVHSQIHIYLSPFIRSWQYKTHKITIAAFPQPRTYKGTHNRRGFPFQVAGHLVLAKRSPSKKRVKGNSTTSLPKPCRSKRSGVVGWDTKFRSLHHPHRHPLFLYLLPSTHGQHPNFETPSWFFSHFQSLSCQEDMYST